jgi:hypothetical protein
MELINIQEDNNMKRSKKKQIAKAKKERIMENQNQNVKDQVVDVEDQDQEIPAETEVVEEPKKEGFFKRHSKAVKRAAIGLGAGVIGLVGFCLGRGSAESESEDDDDFDDEEDAEFEDDEIAEGFEEDSEDEESEE